MDQQRLRSKMILVLMFLATNYPGSEAIIGGRLALGDQFPYMASLQNAHRGHDCGAAIIHELFLLTAGHCVYKEKEYNYIIEYDTVKLNEGLGQVVPVRKFFMHPEYVPETYMTRDSSDSSDSEGFGDVMDKPTQNDIAIVEAAWSMTDGVNPSLPFFKFQNDPGTEYTVAKIGLASSFPGPCTICTLAGWGKLVDSMHAQASKDLMYMLLSIHSCLDCKYGFCEFRDKIFCAQDLTRVAGAANGDSGGPLVCNGLVAGIVTTGDHGTGRVIQFVDINQYRSFIDPFLYKIV